MGILEIINSAFVSRSQQPGYAHEDEREKPRCPPKRGNDDDANAGRALAPYTVAVGRRYLKSVSARRDVRIIGRPPCSGFYPTRVKAGQSVTEFDPIRIDEAQARICNLEIFPARFDAQLGPGIYDSIVYGDFVDDYGRRLKVYFCSCRIDDGNPSYGREPQASVSGLYAGRLIPSIAFLIEHSVTPAVRNCRNLVGAAVRKIVELLLLDPVYAEIATDPEIAARILEYLKGPIVEKPVAGRKSREAFAAESVQPGVISAYPERLAIFIKRAHHV